MTSITAGTIFLLFAFFLGAQASLHVPIGSIKGTESVPFEMTDKQQAIQRWLAFLTFLQPNNGSEFGWKYWDANVNNPQLGLESTRYPLAFVAYTAGVLAYKTPAYREVAIQILDNVVQRLLVKATWQYIEKYWKARPTFPDPVVYENIMYSGHLSQVIALYESISGDMKYSDRGFDFVWNATNVMHYNLYQLNTVIYKQMVDEKNGGGNHPHIGFALHDAIHGTNFSAMDSKWQEYMQKYGMEDIPWYKNDRYLKILYQRQVGAWLPVATSGNDGWALSWMPAWSNDMNFICKGWNVMHGTSKWRDAATGGKYIANDIVGSMLELNMWLATSFYPVLEKQCNTNLTMTDRYTDAILYFENAYATFEDTDGDGHADAYFYNGDPQYRIWLTANLLTAMLIQDKTLSQMYHENFAQLHAKEPFVTNVDYPTILVRQAYYNVTSQVLHFAIQTQISQNVDKTTFIVHNMDTVQSIRRNGQIWTQFEKISDSTIRVSTNVGGDDHVEFRIAK